MVRSEHKVVRTRKRTGPKLEAAGREEKPPGPPANGRKQSTQACVFVVERLNLSYY